LLAERENVKGRVIACSWDGRAFRVPQHRPRGEPASAPWGLLRLAAHLVSAQPATEPREAS
jgi:hypothetical protein